MDAIKKFKTAFQLFTFN